jgi:hypothetical protein
VETDGAGDADGARVVVVARRGAWPSCSARALKEASGAIDHGESNIGASDRLPPSPGGVRSRSPCRGVG